jgi:hypothetical protein
MIEALNERLLLTRDTHSSDGRSCAIVYMCKGQVQAMITILPLLDCGHLCLSANASADPDLHTLTRIEGWR